MFQKLKGLERLSPSETDHIFSLEGGPKQALPEPFTVSLCYRMHIPFSRKVLGYLFLNYEQGRGARGWTYFLHGRKGKQDHFDFNYSDDLNEVYASTIPQWDATLFQQFMAFQIFLLEEFCWFIRWNLSWLVVVSGIFCVMMIGMAIPQISDRIIFLRGGLVSLSLAVLGAEALRWILNRFRAEDRRDQELTDFVRRLFIAMVPWILSLFI
jgi:hypothetical protein